MMSVRRVTQMKLASQLATAAREVHQTSQGEAEAYPSKILLNYFL